MRYNEPENSIEIKDGQKMQRGTLLFVFALTVVNSIINLYYLDSRHSELVDAIWMFLGSSSFVILIWYLLKKTALSKIPLKEISRLNEKNILRKKKYSIELTNGKSRDLAELKDQSDITEIKNLFTELGIKSA